MTFDELFDAAEAQEYSSVDFAIDDELRLISIPETGMVFGVEGDKDVNTVGFIANRYYRGTDLAEFDIRVVYENANGELDYYTVTDKASDESTVTFSWTMGASAFKYQGTITLAVNFLKTDSSGEVEQAFNTTIATGNCLVGLSLDDADVPTDTLEDLLAHLTADLQAAERQAVDNVKSAQNTAEQAIDTAKQQAVQAAQAEAEKAATSAGQAASSAAEAAQSATNVAAEVGKVQSAGTAAVQAVQQAQSTATEAVSDAQQSATQAVSQAQTAAVSAVQEAGTTQTGTVESAGTAAVSAVSNAKTEALSQISTAGTAQVSVVETAGTDAVEDVNDAKTAALEAIDAANAALPSPTQSDAGKVPTVKVDGSAYELAGPYAPLSAAIRPTASGNPVSITDSVEWPLLGLKVYGKSTQDGTPSLENPVPIVSAGEGGSVDVTVCGVNLLDLSQGKNGTGDGVTFTKNSDGSYQMTGTATGTAGNVWFLGEYRETQALFYLQPGTYFVQDCALFYNGKDIAASDKTETKFVLTKTTPVGGVRNPVLLAGETYNKTLYPAVFVGETAQPWKPYSGQSLALSTPNGLPGIPVDSGGNYTDASGQQWISDKITESKKIHFLRYLDNSNYDTMIFNTSFSNDSVSICFIPPLYGVVKKFHAAIMSNMFIQGGHGGALLTVGEMSLEADGSVYFGLPPTVKSSLDAQNYMKTNSVKVLVQLAVPTETSLSVEELAAYRALHTYDGATVVSIAEDVAGLGVKYLADGEKYVERIVSQKAPEAAAAHTMALLADGIREGVNGV